MAERASSLALAVVPEDGKVAAAPAEIGDQASVPNGSARTEEAEATSEYGGHSGSD